MNNHVTVLEIDGNALNHNLSFLKNKLHTTTKIMAVVKAYAYGSDGVLVADFLKDKVDYFAVAYTDEGIALREYGIETPILVLHPQIQNFDAIIKYRLEPSLYNFKTFHEFLKVADKQLTLNYPVHLKFNTGLNRLGFWHNDVPALISEIKQSNHLQIASIFSHLAATEDNNERQFTLQQLYLFHTIVQDFDSALEHKPLVHTLNTSGIINYPEAQFDMVRTGIGLYGFGNDEDETKQLKNTHQLKSIISQIHLLEPGETVGYNRAFIAKDYTKTATIPIGHADGISRQLGNGKGYVIIKNKKAPIIGNVCMDMIMVDITGFDCKEGDEVFIFKTQEDILHMAKQANTISYEIITAISQRVKRIFKS